MAVARAIAAFALAAAASIAVAQGVASPPSPERVPADAGGVVSPPSQGAVPANAGGVVHPSEALQPLLDAARSGQVLRLGPGRHLALVLEHSSTSAATSPAPATIAAPASPSAARSLVKPQSSQ